MKVSPRAFCDSLSGPCAVSSLIRARPMRKMPDARVNAEHFRQDLQDGQDLNVGLCHPVHPVHPVYYVCVPCRFWTLQLAGKPLNKSPLKLKSA
ncbi:MAG: hypothetical protein GQ533_09920 [Methanosarcinaceae archaeon]|nr:hypothetical protein [Methanosarcinaceae archaeon]